MGKVRRFEVTAAGDFASVLAVLTDHLGLRLVTLDEVDRCWLDTADALLAKGGTTLELRRPRAEGTPSLLWSGDGRVLATDPCVSPEPPVGADDLPTSVAFARVATLLGDAALLAGPTVESRVAALVSLDDEDKTTVRLVLDQSHTADGDRFPMLLEIVPLRGYESDAAKLEKALHRRVALASSSTSMKERVTGSSGPERSELGLLATNTAAEAWRIVLRQLTDVMTRTFAGVLRGDDPEDLHAFRVAVRRIRTLLQDGGDIIDPDLRDRFRRDFRWLGDITTPTRDADVHLEEFPELVAALPTEQRRQTADFEAILVAHRTDCHRSMVVELRSMRRAEFGTAWAAFLADDDVWAGAGELAASPARPVVLGRIAKAHRQLIKNGRRITKTSPPISLHELRKEGKRLRYLLECFEPLLDPEASARVLRPLRELQDVLGQFQDTEVQAEALLGLADAAAVTSDLDGVVAPLRARGAEARRSFAGTFGRFDDRKVQRAFDRLEPRRKKTR